MYTAEAVLNGREERAGITLGIEFSMFNLKRERRREGHGEEKIGSEIQRSLQTQHTHMYIDSIYIERGERERESVREKRGG